MFYLFVILKTSFETLLTQGLFWGAGIVVKELKTTALLPYCQKYSYFKIYYETRGIEWIVKHTDNKEGGEHWLPTTYQHNCY